MCVGGLCCAVVSGGGGAENKGGQSLGVMCRVNSLFLSRSSSSSLFLCFLFFVLLPPLLPPRPVESDNTLRIKNEKTRSLLLFTNVTEKHFGNYTCFASNRLGASNASMLLFRKSSHGPSWRSPGLGERALTFISTQPSITERECEQTWRTSTKQYICNDTVFCLIPRPVSFLLCTPHSLFQASPPSLFPFLLFSAPLKLCLPILRLPLTLIHSRSHPPSLLRTHSHTRRLPLCSLPLPKKLSFLPEADSH